MKKNLLHNTYIQFFFIFLFFCLYYAKAFITNCITYPNLSFDSQALLTWDYNAYLGMIPYKDIFYPYGLLTYYKNYLSLFHYISSFIVPMLFASLYLLLSKLIKDKMQLVVIFIFIFIFIEKFIGYETFARYGVVTVSSLAVAYFTFEKKLKELNIIVIGICNSIIFSLLTDQGIYISIIVLFFLAISTLQYKTKYQAILFLFKNVLVFLIGIIIGLIPLYIYLNSHNALNDFLRFYISLNELSLYAKTSFIHSFLNPENIFYFGIIFFAILYTTRAFLKGQTNTITLYYTVALLLVLLLLEQKNILRSINTQITFVGYLLLCVMLSNFLQSKRNIIFFCVLGIIAINPFFITNNSQENPFYNYSSQTCVRTNEMRLFQLDQDYIHVIEQLNQNDKIFSFPSDPIFYIAHNQVPPYYSNTYDASSYTAQQRLIQYIRSNKIQKVIINTEIRSIQDSVPEYIRSSYLLQYILTHFTFQKRVGKFLILKSDMKAELMTSDDKDIKDFKTYLLHPALGAIPRSEGMYKYSFITPNAKFVSVQLLNESLRLKPVSSQNIFLIILPKNKLSPTTDVTIYSGNISTTVTFQSCSSNSYCIIHLSKLPLFYTPKKITAIQFPSSYIGDVALKNNTNSVMW